MEAGVSVTGVVEVEITEVDVAEVGAFDVTGPPVVGLTPVVAEVVMLPEDLQAEDRETDDMAAPSARMPALFKNCRLEYLVTRKMDFFPRLLDFSFSIMSHLTEAPSYHLLTVPTIASNRD